MLAVDTNILLRYLTADDADQYARASAIFSGNVVWVAKTVLLEADWVLRRSFGYPTARVVATFRALADMAGVRLEKPDEIAEALTLCAAGLSFADALHVASSDGAERFMTFDEPLARRAAGRSSIAVAQA